MATGVLPKKSLKDIIAEEYKKCATDPIHFMKKYCYIKNGVIESEPQELPISFENIEKKFHGTQLSIPEIPGIGISIVGHNIKKNDVI